MCIYIGQKVTSKNGKPWKSLRGAILDQASMPKFGEVYTVRAKLECDCGLGLLFFEIKPLNEIGEELAFDADEFRPLCDRPTSIEIFKRAPKPAPAWIRIETVKERV